MKASCTWVHASSHQCVNCFLMNPTSFFDLDQWKPAYWMVKFDCWWSHLLWTYSDHVSIMLFVTVSAIGMLHAYVSYYMSTIKANTSKNRLFWKECIHMSTADTYNKLSGLIEMVKMESFTWKTWQKINLLSLYHYNWDMCIGLDRGYSHIN